MKKIIFKLIIPLWGLGSALYAQHEFQIYGGGGLSGLNSKLTVGKQSIGLGGHFGLGYGYFFHPNWGVITGVEAAFYNAKYRLGTFNDRYTAVDLDGVAFEFRTQASNYVERQRALMLQIPLMLQYQTGGDKRQFYAAAGGKVGFPLNGKYKSTVALNNSGYYAHEDYEYTTDRFMGFGSYPDKKSDGALDFKTAYFASAELGVKWKLKGRMSLYTGAYLDYGLNNIRKVETGRAPSPQQHLVAYNTASPPDFTVHSIVLSQHAQNGAHQPFTDKVTPLAVGVKVRLAFGKSASPSSPPEPAPEPAPAIIPDRPDDEAQRIADDEAKRKADDETKRIAKAQDDERQRIADDTAKRQEEERRKAEDAKREIAIGTIQRPVNRYVLSQMDPAAVQIKELDEIIACLQQYPDMMFYINGHTCDIGTREANERVGLQRAEKAKAYLISKGINANRIQGLASKRDTQPLVPNTNEENRKINRRVEFVVVK